MLTVIQFALQSRPFDELTFVHLLVIILVTCCTGLWIAGITGFVVFYLPQRRRASIAEKARSLITITPYYLALIVGGVVVAGIATLFDIILFHISLTYLLSNLSSQMLALEILLICLLSVICVIHLNIVYPQIRKEHQKYIYVLQRMKQSAGASENLIEQIKQREERLISRTRRLNYITRCEAVAGVAMLVTVILANIFGSGPTLPVATTQQQVTNITRKPFTVTIMTTDNQFKLTCVVNPNHFGPNEFTVSIENSGLGTQPSIVNVSLSLTMLDMNMGTETLNLHVEGQNLFSGTGDLSMTGNWSIQILIQTQDRVLHTAQIKLLTPF